MIGKKSGLHQTKLAMDKLQPKEQEELADLATIAIYADGKSLDLFNKPHIIAFINKLNPAFVIPSRKTFSETLLDKAYLKIKNEVQEQLDQATYLNFICDGSQNINKERITNLSVQTDVNAFQLASKELSSFKHGAAKEAA